MKAIKILNELYKVRGKKSLYSGLPHKDYDSVRHFIKKVTTRTLKSRPISIYRRMAGLLDVPLSFLVSIIRIERNDEDEGLKGDNKGFNT